jgi:proteasome beta subunit
MTTTIGITCSDGVVLAADKRASKGFFVGSKAVNKLFMLDDATAVAIAGQMSDAEYLVNLAKAERRLISLRRGYPLNVHESARLISNIVYNGMKSYNPFYVELVVAGVDAEGPHVFTADMSGAITSEPFMASGSGSPLAYGVMEQGFRQGLDIEAGKRLAEQAVRAAMERDPGSGNGVDVLAVGNDAWREVA